ncbi:type 1 glutamine amidotransferase [Foetidibacter luteolus]|uniref:type 1 glutamine amidotransferase n=1 Tax=Foetidibacter luteolus TaxID=2608880 RepID=UPI00129AE5A3|nr:type 1 glutamine amidotransferase [Foetidibacter luteolus]
MHVHFIQHVPFEYPGSIIDWCGLHGHTYSITHMYGDFKFPATAEFDMLVMMGGPMGAYETDTYAWLKAEKAFIAAAIADRKKVLGICLGAQLIADVLGAEVHPHTEKEIGWWPVQKTVQHPLTAQLPDTFTCFHWHGDTYTLPQGAIQLLQSACCNQQGFVYGSHVAGFQFHPEVKENLLDDMTEHERAELVKSTYVQTEQEIISATPHHILQQQVYMHSLLDAFVRL